MHVRDGSCRLSRGYSDESEQVYPNTQPGQFTIFDSFDLRFIVPVEWERPSSEKFEIGKLYLFLYTKIEPKLSSQQWRIDAARINGHSFARIERHNAVQEKYYRNFSLGNSESIEVFKLFLNNDPPTLELQLSNGGTETLSAPARASDHFGAWARMLSACASDASASRIICPDSELEPAEWVKKHLDRSDVVFLGKVISAEIPDPKPVEQREITSMQELLERIERGQSPGDPQHYDQTATFEVIKSWKGTAAPRIVTRTHFVYGTGPFKVGDTYLVFGYKEEDSRIFSVSTDCASTLRAENAADRIALLDELTEAQ